MTAPKQTSRAMATPPAWRAPLVVAVLGALWWVLLPEQLGLLTRLAYTALFVLSLDLVVGVAGLPTLGHAALFGTGAYAAGIFATHVSADPLLGLLVGAGTGAVMAGVSGLFLLRFQGFTFLMLTVAFSQILLNLANKFRDWTGGDDGLATYVMDSFFGRIGFDLEGKVASAYALIVLVLGYYLARRLVNSPFGLCVRGIHENRARMAALGTPVFMRLWVVYVVAGLLAGAAGGVAAQANGIVALDSLGFALSAEALVMLILGGAGHLAGAVAGTAVFTVLHHTAASVNPYHWLFVIGLALMVVVMVPSKQLWGHVKAQLGLLRWTKGGAQ
jgi:branched-chain amino acid transport system permease protein